MSLEACISASEVYDWQKERLVHDAEYRHWFPVVSQAVTEAPRIMRCINAGKELSRIRADINLHRESERLTYARDIGVSYFLVGLMAVLTYRIRRPWRWVYLAGLVVIFTVPLLINPDFTAIGHAAALVIGLCCYPLTHPHHPLRHHPSTAGGH